jgi:hypothetical protein
LRKNPGVFMGTSSWKFLAFFAPSVSAILVSFLPCFSGPSHDPDILST